MSDSDENDTETCKIPWPGFAKYFSYVKEGGENILVKCRSCPLDSLSTPKKSPSNLKRHVKLAPTVKDIFHRCYWRGLELACNDIVRFQRTEEGFCYSFNSKSADRSTNTSDQNPPFNGPKGTLIPLRNDAAGKGTGFKVIMHNLGSEFFPEDKRRRGYNVMVHPPEAFPDVSTGYKVHAVRDRITRISVSVAQVKADKSLSRLSKHNDQCFMYKSSWTPSSFFQSDDEDTCYSKCRLKTIYRLCNCTQYFYKLYKGLGTFCGIQHIPCLIANDVMQRNPKAPENDPGFPKWSLPETMNCSCDPPCSFITYTTEMQHDIRQYVNMNMSLSSRYRVFLEVNYRELFATSYRRSMKYSTQDLLVSFGGVASLFLGCSLVSIVELLYVVYKSLLVLKRRYVGDEESVDEASSAEAAEDPKYSFVF